MINLYDYIKESLLDDSDEVFDKGSKVARQMKVLEDIGVISLEAYPSDLEYISKLSKIKSLKTYDLLTRYIDCSGLSQKKKLEYTKIFGLLINLLMNVHKHGLDLWAWSAYSTGSKPSGFTYIENILSKMYDINCLVDVKYHGFHQVKFEIYTSSPCFIKIMCDRKKFDKYFGN